MVYGSQFRSRKRNMPPEIFLVCSRHGILVKGHENVADYKPGFYYCETPNCRGTFVVSEEQAEYMRFIFLDPIVQRVLQDQDDPEWWNPTDPDILYAIRRVHERFKREGYDVKRCREETKKKERMELEEREKGIHNWAIHVDEEIASDQAQIQYFELEEREKTIQNWARRVDEELASDRAHTPRHRGYTRQHFEVEGNTFYERAPRIAQQGQSTYKSHPRSYKRQYAVTSEGPRFSSLRVPQQHRQPTYISYPSPYDWQHADMYAQRS